MVAISDDSSNDPVAVSQTSSGPRKPTSNGLVAKPERLNYFDKILILSSGHTVSMAAFTSAPC